MRVCIGLSHCRKKRLLGAGWACTDLHLIFQNSEAYILIPPWMDEEEEIRKDRQEACEMTQDKDACCHFR